MAQYSPNDFDKLRHEADLEQWADTHLERKGPNNYVCPWCDSGHKKHGTAAGFVFKGTDNVKRFKCHSCGQVADVVDLVKHYYRIENTREAIKQAAQDCGVELDNSSLTGDNVAQPAPSPAPPATITEQQAKGRAEASELIKRTQGGMVASCEAWQYLEGRGFTAEEIAAFGFGYDANNSRRLIIPFSTRDGEWYYMRRAIDSCEHSERYRKPSTNDVGEQPLMNPLGDAIWSKGQIMVVEGALDVYAALAVGMPCLALAGSSDTRHLLEAIKEANYKGDIIVTLDNDKAGQRNAPKLVAELNKAGIHAYCAKLPEEYKDIAEALEVSHDEAKRCIDAVKEQRKEAILKQHRVHTTVAALDNLKHLRNYREPYKTGISELDFLLTGGLRPGLTTMGAPSSVGKTTIAHQIADYQAADGHKVLFVSVEQSADELLAKSIARIMSQQNPGKPYINTQQLVDPACRAKFDDEQNAALDKALETYAATVQPNLYIMEPDNQPSALDITAAAKAIKQVYNVAPIVYVDYLQLLAPQDEHDTDKRTVDKNVLTLRQLARELNTPVFCISSLNRGAYSEAVNMASFKESGAIEYGSDVLLGLQPYHLESWIENTRQKINGSKFEGEQGISKAAASEIVWKQFRAKPVRECGVSLLKNRNGRLTDDEAHLNFICAASRFVSDPGRQMLKDAIAALP